MILVYIDRICLKNPSFTISSLTVHRFILASITCACKALCDAYLTNSSYAKVGGVSTKELNILEMEFLFLIDFQCQANCELLQNYYVNLINHSQISINYSLQDEIKQDEKKQFFVD
jgi:hypothetical protein